MFGSEIMGGSREDDFYLSPAASVRWKIGEQVERALKNHVADPKEASANCRRTQIGPACAKEVYNHGMISGPVQSPLRTQQGVDLAVPHSFATLGLGNRTAEQIQLGQSGTRVVRN